MVFRKRTSLLTTVSLLILAFLIFGFSYDVMTNFKTLSLEQTSDESQSTYLDQFSRLSSKRNIIHIVPDQAQGALLHEILTSDYERYSGVFDGFTLFTQAVGRYDSTYPNILFNLSGESPDPRFDLVLNQPFTQAYIEEVLHERSILSALSQSSFRTFGFQAQPDIYCKGPYTACTGTAEDVFAGGALNSSDRKVILAVLKSMDHALFRITPIVFREQIHDDGRWFAKKLAKGEFTHSGVLDLFLEHIQVEENPGTYNFIHHAGAHAPLLFDQNCKYVGPQVVNREKQGEQLKCTLEQLREMIQALNRVGVYDQTMIIVNGGQGTSELPNSSLARMGYGVSASLMGTASTLMLIKPPGERGELLFSDIPVTTGDIPATIKEAFGLDITFPGSGVFSRTIERDRQRSFYTYDSTSDGSALRDLKRYRIHGNVFDRNNWELPKTAVAGMDLSQLRMGQSNFEAYTEGFSDLEMQEVPVRWVDGKQARVFLFPPSTGPVVLEFESYVPPSIAGQSMVIKINGTLITKLDAKDLSISEQTVALPESLPRGELLEIEFTMGKTINVGDDLRDLSVLFIYIGLMPAG